MKYRLYLLILILLSFIPLLDLLHPGLPLTHDGRDHVARIANFYENLSERILIPRWAPNLNWGYGHPILEFLYPLPSYAASLFHYMNFSLVDSLKIVFAIGMTFSGIAMYLWLSEVFSVEAGLIGGLLYVFAPYRFINLYVRGDIGENFAFIFIPFVFLFLALQAKKNNVFYIFGGSISLACLILSHNAISLMIVPLIIFYGLYLTYFLKDRREFIASFLIILICGFGLATFFWIPALLEGRYTLRNLVTKGTYLGRFVNMPAILYGPWSYGGTGQFTVQLGILQWGALIGSIFFMFKKIKLKEKALLYGLILYTLVAIFFMLPVSTFIWSHISLLQNFQFPWRFLAITVFTTSVLGGWLTIHVSKKYSKLILVLIILFVLYFNKDYWHANGYLNNPESFYTGIYDGTTDTGESAPIWSVRFMEHRAKAPFEVIDGNATIKVNKHGVARHDYTVTASKRTLFLENTLYFPGWQVLVDNKNTKIEFQNQNYRGLMTFYVEKGSHVVSVEYKDTRLRQIALFISISSAIFLLGLVLIKFKVNV